MPKDRSRPPADDLPPDAEITALLARYQPGGVAVGRPLERFLVIVARIDALIARTPDVFALTEPKRATALRAVLFQLEAMLRLYKSELGKKGEQALEQVKALESQLGAVDLCVALRTEAEAAAFPLPTIARLYEEESAARAAACEMLREAWLPDHEKRDQIPALNKLVKQLCKRDWPSYDDDRAFLREQLAAEIGKFAKKVFDFAQLEGDEGVHEARRKARWIPIYCLALGGLVQLDETANPIPALAKLLADPEAKSPYLVMSASTRERAPILVSKSLIISNSKLVAALGKIKDDGGLVEGLARALRDTAQADGDAEARVVALLGSRLSNTGYQSATEKIFGEFQGLGVLDALRVAIAG